MAAAETAEEISAGSQAKAIASPVERLDPTHWLQANDPPHAGEQRALDKFVRLCLAPTATSGGKAIDGLQKTGHLEQQAADGDETLRAGDEGHVDGSAGSHPERSSPRILGPRGETWRPRSASLQAAPAAGQAIIWTR